MARTLRITVENFPIAGAFTISRGSKTEARVITVTLAQGDATGRGECVPYARYGESISSVSETIEAARVVIEAGCSRDDLLGLMPAGAARNAVDCALWDLEAKQSGTSVGQKLVPGGVEPLVTAFTLSMGTPLEMEQAAREASFRPLLKVKVGAPDDEARIRAVRAGAPDSRIILDANEGWNSDNIVRLMEIAAECRISLIEQPLPSGRDELLAHIPHAVPVCADESLLLTSDLENLCGKYDAVNIKLDKTGGLTEGLTLAARARELGFEIMVGCMVGTSLAMAPAVFLAQGAQYVDLDGPLLLAQDREPGLRYEGSTVFPPDAELWG